MEDMKSFTIVYSERGRSKLLKDSKQSWNGNSSWAQHLLATLSWSTHVCVEDNIVSRDSIQPKYDKVEKRIGDAAQIGILFVYVVHVGAGVGYSVQLGVFFIYVAHIGV